MKKKLLTIAIVLGMSIGAFAQEGGLFGYGFIGANNNWDDFGWNRTTGTLITLPGQHNQLGDAQAPLGSGIAVLAGLGAAYLLGKKRKEK